MDKELIRQIKLKPDGVYIYSKADRDDDMFRFWKSDVLTDVYAKEGQRGLDREVVRMLCEYAEISGKHPSMERYRPCLLARGHFSIFLCNILDNEFDKLSPADIRTVSLPKEKQTEMAREYNETKRDELKVYYTVLAGCAAPLPEGKHKSSCGRDMAR